MKITIITTLILALILPAWAQVSIGTDSLQQLLTVKGSILVDQSNQNYGTIDSAALLFGSNSGNGIGSKRMGTGNLNGIGCFTNDTLRLTINENGHVGIGTDSPSTHLDVNGEIYANDRLHTLGDIHVGNNVNIDQNMNIDGVLRINGTTGSYYKLNVGGNAKFNNDLRVTGDVTVAENITVNNHPLLLSDELSPLRIAFAYIDIDTTYIYSGDIVIFQVDIPSYVGNSNFVKVLISQFIPEPVPASIADKVKITATNSSGGGVPFCNIAFYNPGGGGNKIKGRLHVMVVIKD